MSTTSLSTCLAPTLIQMPPLRENLQPADLLALANTSEEPRVVELLILYHQDVFDDTIAFWGTSTVVFVLENADWY